MNMPVRVLWSASAALIGSLVAIVAAAADRGGSTQERRHGERARPVHTSPIALSSNDALLWVVNPDSNSVTVIRTDRNRVVATLAVGEGPRSIALAPDGRVAYVANALSGDISIIDVESPSPRRFRASVRRERVTTGSGAVGVIVSPDGRRVFVANESQDTISVLDTTPLGFVASLDLRSSVCNGDDLSRHFQPRALAMTADARTLYVTRFLSYTRPGGVQGDDYGKEGVVCRVDVDTTSSDPEDYQPARSIRLAPSDAGFPGLDGSPTGAFPNQLQSIVIRNDHAYLPNVAASPSGPENFDTDTQAYVNRIDGIGADESDGGALNLHLGARAPESGKPELYFANPWAIAFTSDDGAGSAYVVSAGSDVLVKLRVDEEGRLHFTGSDTTTRYIDLNDPDDPATGGANAGKNPIGLVVNADGSRAYVLNYVSRNVSVVDLGADRVESVVSTSALPPPGSDEEVLLVGAEMFFSSRGSFVRAEGALGQSRDRLSVRGHQNCASCHSGGLTDGVIWTFASGPRKTIPINGTFDPTNLDAQRIINASAIFDELEDADLNTRRVSSGEPLAQPLVCAASPPTNEVVESRNDPDHGLILGEEGDFELAPCVINQFATPNEGRPQPLVQLSGSAVQVRALDALKEWQRQSILSPTRPMSEDELLDAGVPFEPGRGGSTSEGRRLFVEANCAACHGGGQWSRSVKDFVSPPDPSEIATEYGAPNANQQEFLFRFLKDIGSFGLNVADGSNVLAGFPAIGAIEKDAGGLDALGFDYNGDGKGNGFSPPSLLGAFQLAPYYHNGACETLACVVADVNHRRAALRDGQADRLDGELERDQLVRYLESIDDSTPHH
jgi:YVTN family beta-propeller protein